MKRQSRFERVLEDAKPASPKEWEEKARALYPMPVGLGEGEERNNFYSFNRDHMKWALDAALHQAYISGLVQGVHEMENMLVFVQMQAPKDRKLRKLLRDYIDEIKNSIAEGRKGRPR